MHQLSTRLLSTLPYPLDSMVSIAQMIPTVRSLWSEKLGPNRPDDPDGPDDPNAPHASEDPFVLWSDAQAVSGNKMLKQTRMCNYIIYYTQKSSGAKFR